MKLPSNWDAVFTSAFYDKNVTIMSRQDSYDSEGGLVTSVNTGTQSFVGNVRYDKLEELQRNYGLQEKIDLAITTSTTTSLDLNIIVRYSNVDYIVISVIPFDSHKLVACKKWK